MPNCYQVRPALYISVSLGFIPPSQQSVCGAHLVRDIYRLRSRGDNTFGSIRVFVCVFVLWRGVGDTHETQVQDHLPLPVHGFCLCL